MAQAKAAGWVEDACRHGRIPVHICIAPPGLHFRLAALAVAGKAASAQVWGRARVCRACISPPTHCHPHTNACDK